MRRRTAKAENDRRLREAGFSLVELMVAIVSGIILVGATYAIYISQQRSFTSQDQVAEVNNTSKVALDIISNDIREIGFGIPPASAFNPVSEIDLVANAQDNRAIGAREFDSAEFWGAYDRIGTLCSNSTGLRVGRKDTIVKIVGKYGDTRPPAVGDLFTIGGITDKLTVRAIAVTWDNTRKVNDLTITIAEPHVGMEFPKYTDTNVNALCDPDEGVPVFNIGGHTYEVQPHPLDPGVNQLVRNGEVLLDNVEEFQLVYGVDPNGVGIPTAWVHTPPANQDTLRTVRVSLLTRTSSMDPQYMGPANNAANILGNRAAAFMTYDNFRRRLWQQETAIRTKR